MFENIAGNGLTLTDLHKLKKKLPLMLCSFPHSGVAGGGAALPTPTWRHLSGWIKQSYRAGEDIEEGERRGRKEGRRKKKKEGTEGE